VGLGLSAPRAEAQFAFSGAPSFGWGWGWPAGGAATPAESFALGASAIIRAQGEYNLNTSQALINYEDARARYVANHRKALNEYFTSKEQNQEWRAKQIERRRASPDSLAQAARDAAPRALGPESYNAITGRIWWPEVLRDDKYVGPRTELEQLYETRAATGGNRAGTLVKIHAATAEMLVLLREDIDLLHPNEYMQARKFIESLDHMAVRGQA
jgi:hypothetical protein